MGVFNSIRNALNPCIVEQFNDLYKHHYQALKLYCSAQSFLRLRSDMSYGDKKIIVDNKEFILELYQRHLQAEEMNEHIQDVISASIKYPHAFISLCGRCLGGILDSTVRMPGEIKSDRQKNIEQEGSSFSSSFLDKRLKYDSFPHEFIPHNAEQLRYPDIEKLYVRLSEFSPKEKFILEQLENEDISITFDDKVLDNKRRSKYYSLFLELKGRSKSDKEYCVNQLNSLDFFITDQINKKYDKLKKKYPKGLTAYEKVNSSQSKEAIMEKESDIGIYEKNAKEVEFYDIWENSQKEYTNKCRNLRDEILSSWGCSFYDVRFEKINYWGDTVNGVYRVWQSFHGLFCSAEDLDYTCCQSAILNYRILDEFRNNKRVFINIVYDKIIDYITKIESLFGAAIVVFGHSDYGNWTALNDYHFKYFRDKLDEKGISNLDISDISLSVGQKNIVIVELITTNQLLETTCSKIISICKSTSPNITYVSLYKEVDRTKMIDLINKKNSEIEIKKREEERIKQEVEEQTNIVNRAKAIVKSCPHAIKKYYPDQYTIDVNVARDIINSEHKLRDYQNFLCSVKSVTLKWELLKGIPYYFFYYYYPKRFTEITQTSQRVRDLIYDFKNGISHVDVLCMIKSKLRSDFNSNNLSELTLVCIPASTISKNKARYQNFSSELCSSLNMKNAFEYITITREKTESHLGGTDNAEYSFNKPFFNDSKVVIFDDVVTKGHSMQCFKNILEGLGATVVCAISIGRTYSDYYGDNRRPHPWTNSL